eukprot:m.27708 g.27708  ORF g.27708 m.27708 type:complete len:473 (+) comp5972_c0_seq2:115-1533(+)
MDREMTFRKQRGVNHRLHHIHMKHVPTDFIMSDDEREQSETEEEEDTVNQTTASHTSSSVEDSSWNLLYEDRAKLNSTTQLSSGLKTFPFTEVKDYKKTEGTGRNLRVNFSQHTRNPSQTWWDKLLDAYSSFFGTKTRSIRLFAVDSILQVTAPHPYHQVVASGRRDGTVEIRDANKEYVDVLSIQAESFSIHKDRVITAMAWCPSRKDTLCVATRKSVLLWTIGNDTEACQYSELSPGGAHAIEWSPCGIYVLIAPVSGGLILWDTATSTMLRILSIHHFRMIKWDSSGRRVVCSTWGKEFVVFDVGSGWEPTIMKAVSGSFVDVCWSKMGDFFVYAERGSRIVQCFQFASSKMPQISSVITLSDLECDDGKETISGLAWDKNSQRLAIMTEKDGETTTKVRVCFTRTQSSSIHATDSKYVIERYGNKIQDIHFGTTHVNGKDCPLLVLTWQTKQGCTIDAIPFFYTPRRD